MNRIFRVISKGAENIPEFGSAILAANHSGNIPIDAMMLWNDVLRQTEPPRVARGIADHFVPALPFIGTLFARAGMVGGSAGNVRSLLDKGELLMIFPEGVPGIIKPWEERYQLVNFSSWARSNGDSAFLSDHSDWYCRCRRAAAIVVLFKEIGESLWDRGCTDSIGSRSVTRSLPHLLWENQYQFMSDMILVKPTIQRYSKRLQKRSKRQYMNLYSRGWLIEQGCFDECVGNGGIITHW